MYSLDIERLMALLKQGGGAAGDLREAAAAACVSNLKFIPNPGPQTEAYYSPADILLYGGEGGGGKSALINGLALNAHHTSLIMRRKYSDLAALTDEIVRMNGTRKGFAAAPRPRLTLDDGRLIEYGACQYLGDEQSWQGQAHDLIGFDEASQFLKMQVEFVMGWNRPRAGAPPGQRSRVVMATNPPLSSDGDWIIGMFRPWLDLTHPSPARQGELRWFITAPDGSDIEVPGPVPVEVDGKTYRPLSRTFIRARVSDNPFLANTDYQSRLDALPEPLRSAVRDGNFMAARQDDPWQVIPTDWIRQAMARWTPQPLGGIPMCAMGVDVAQGGADKTVIAVRYDGWFGPLIEVAGEKTPHGTDVAGLVVAHRHDNAHVVIDMGGGYGGAAWDHLVATIGKDKVRGFVPGGASVARTANGQMKCKNRRADGWWGLREALDPGQQGGSPIMLPDDPGLLSDLSAPRLVPEAMQRGEIQIESKEDLKKRLGRSTDKGDAVVMAWSEGAKAISHATLWREAGGKARPGMGRYGAQQQTANMGYENKRRRR